MKSGTKPGGKSAWEQARQYGVDMSLLAANLQKKPAELLRQHERAQKVNLQPILGDQLQGRHRDHLKHLES